MVSRANSTTKGIWEGMEFRQGPCRNVLPFNFPFCCFAGPPEMYKLSSTRISIQHIQYHINCFGSFCGYREVKDNIDLTKIVDVDYLSENPGCCSCDVGRSVLQIMDINEKQYLMHLEEEKAKSVAVIIQAAIEENTLREARNLSARQKII
uniref:Uncharacterized protein n=1 Tax=Bigelowiella natans TaxID=227086 RepID=A0A6T9YFY1_BIGNA|mmetsp:Transcript_1158/g.1784  ORF Transcript_1158/g.1784 Transcript_1158/m.1784 type:complete len:151 (+) Transcript_1158:383-835(+)